MHANGSMHGHDCESEPSESRSQTLLRMREGPVKRTPTREAERDVRKLLTKRVRLTRGAPAPVLAALALLLAACTGASPASPGAGGAPAPDQSGGAVASSGTQEPASGGVAHFAKVNQSHSSGTSPFVIGQWSQSPPLHLSGSYTVTVNQLWCGRWGLNTDIRNILLDPKFAPSTGYRLEPGGQLASLPDGFYNVEQTGMAPGECTWDITLTPIGG